MLLERWEVRIGAQISGGACVRLEGDGSQKDPAFSRSTARPRKLGQPIYGISIISCLVGDLCIDMLYHKQQSASQQLAEAICYLVK